MPIRSRPLSILHTVLVASATIVSAAVVATCRPSEPTSVRPPHPVVVSQSSSPVPPSPPPSAEPDIDADASDASANPTDASPPAPWPGCNEISSLAPLSSPPLAPASPTPAGTIRCGDRHCDAATQVCCRINGSLSTAVPDPKLPPPACARRVPIGTVDSGFGETPWYRQQSKVCVRALGVQDDSSLITLSLCDDSKDCPGNRVCTRTHGTCGPLTAQCQEWFYADHCVPLTALATEYCVLATDCRTPGTICHQGECVLEKPTPTCGAKNCPPDKICCWRREQCFECTDRTACIFAHAPQECTSSRDCPAPRRCRAVFEDTTVGELYYRGSSCERGWLELCETIDDCEPTVDGVPVSDCVHERLGSDFTGSSNSPLVGVCRY